MEDKDKKKKRIQTVYLDVELKEKVNKLSYITEISQTEIISNAIAEFFEKPENAKILNRRI